MTTRFWIGPSGDEWFTTAAWNPAGVPAAGDEAVVETGAPLVTGTVSVNGVQILLGSDIFANPARLVLTNGAIGATTTITIDRVSPYASLELDAGAVFDGTVNVGGGQFGYTADAAIAGNGGITLGRGGSVTIGGTVASAPSVSFLDDNGTLILNNPSAYSGAITGLRTGGRIALGHGFILDHVSFANDQLTLFGQGQTIIA